MIYLKSFLLDIMQGIMMNLNPLLEEEDEVPYTDIK